MTLSPVDELDIITICFSRSNSKYLGGKPICNNLQNLDSTKGVLEIPEMRQFEINDMAFTYVTTSTGT